MASQHRIFELSTYGSQSVYIKPLEKISEIIADKTKKMCEEYRELYNSTTDAKRAELNECAKFLNFNTQADIDSFWNNSDLKSMGERQMMYESFMNSTPNIIAPRVSNDLPYSMENVMKHVALFQKLQKTRVKKL